MSHTIIIKKSNVISGAYIGADQVQDSSTIDAEITYTPSHLLTDEYVGHQVAKILKKIGQMGDGDA